MDSERETPPMDVDAARRMYPALRTHVGSLKRRVVIKQSGVFVFAMAVILIPMTALTMASGGTVYWSNVMLLMILPIAIVVASLVRVSGWSESICLYRGVFIAGTVRRKGRYESVCELHMSTASVWGLNAQRLQLLRAPGIRPGDAPTVIQCADTSVWGSLAPDQQICVFTLGGDMVLGVLDGERLIKA